MGEWDPYRALYIHIPFCRKRCGYCDFTTEAIAADDRRLDAYTEAVIAQIRRYSNQDMLGSIETVYLGGGTPSYLGNKRLSSLVYALSVSMHLTPDVECTLEANPDSLTEAMVKDLYALGVTRISLGVQSFDDALLRRLGRVHDADRARWAIRTARLRFENVSIDLMCGLPGQTADSFMGDVKEAIDSGVTHISIYPLTIEEGTPFASLADEGSLIVDDDQGARLMDMAATYLAARGFARYEVASYARKGFESRHNRAYWSAKPYLGIGHGAVSMRQNGLCRERFDEEGTIETLDPFQMAAEDMMLAMRTSEGVADEDAAIAVLLLPDLTRTLESLEHDGYIVHTHGRWKPTHKGWLFGNHLYGTLLDMAP